MPRLRLPPCLSRENGQVLAIAAVMLTGLLGFMGLIIDGGLLYAQRRQAQNAADQAAVAAAYALAEGDTPASVTLAATEYANANGFGGTSGTVTVNVPPLEGEFAGNPDYVEVIVADEPVTFFIHALPGALTDVSARGVATYLSGGGSGWALFANNDDCGNPDTLEISGNLEVVNGGVHSNGNSKVPGNENDFNGGFTYNCNLTVSGTSNDFDPAAAQGPVQEFPVSYTYADFPCDREFADDTDLRSVDDIWVGGDDSSNELLPGVYCSLGKLVLSGGSGVTGEVTLAALGEINISGNASDLTPHWNGILLFTEDATSSAIDVSGNTLTFQGLIVAPNGGAKVQGNNSSSLMGAVLADTIYISGEGFAITAVDYGQGGPTRVALVE